MGFYLLEHAPTNGTQWQQWAYPRRGGGKLTGTCIMHTSESVLDVIGDDSGAEDVARFIGSRTGSYGSYHDIVDSDSIIEMVPFEYEAWQDSETNNWAVGISAACRTTDWLTMGGTKREGYYRNLAWCAADFVKYMRAVYGIEVPRKRITGEQARAGVPGFCAHGDSGLYRTDPGKDFDWDRFFRYTDEALNGEEVSAAEIAKALVEQPVTYFDPVTGKPTSQTTTLGVMAGAADFQHEATRRLLKDFSDVILNAIKAIPEVSDDLIADLKTELSNKLDESLANLKVTLEVTPDEPSA
jgi:hypothetical protein